MFLPKMVIASSIEAFIYPFSQGLPG